MVKKKQRQRWSDYYTHKYPEIWKERVLYYGFTDYHRIVLDHLAVRPHERLLEVGVGTGFPLALDVARRSACTVGLDLAASLLETCQKNFENEGLVVFLCQGDGENLPFKDNSFDKVYAISTTWYVLDLEALLSEMMRVTKPGSIVVFDMLNILHISGFVGAVYNILRNSRILERVRPSRCLHKYRSPFQIRRILSGIGSDYRLTGYFILLPTSLPLFGDKADICKYSRHLSFGLADSPLRFFGAKLLYVCQKSF